VAINDDFDSVDLVTQSMFEFADRIEKSADEDEELPSDWLEANFIIPTPRDPVTGEDLSAGPIRLADHQRRIINEALSKVNGRFKYSTVIYSAPKKSGKSAIASAVALYMASKTAFGQIYALGNDGKNSKDRLYLPIWRCLNFHKQRGLLHKEARVNQVEAFLSNNSHIEAIPCDASGEAGSEPTGVFYSEFWGYIEENKRRLFTEMTLPPTLYGKAIRWIESYAGFMGVSDLLWEMYSLGKEGVPHPDFTDLVGRDGEPVVWANHRAHVFMYWDTLPRMVWQNDDYYQQEAQILSDSEFQRIHQNQWVSPMGSFIQSSWWAACSDPTVPKLTKNSTVPVVLGVDAAISGDCASIAVVSRDPHQPMTDIAIRDIIIFEPKPGHPIKIEEQIGKAIRDLAKIYNVVCVAYDSYQMEGLAQNYRRGNVTLTADEIAYYKKRPKEELSAYMEQESRAAQRWFYQFGQNISRGIADKRLYDMIINRSVHYNPNDVDSAINEKGDEETLAKHIKQAGRKESGKEMRIEKLADNAHIDAAVALSMAVDRCMRMDLDNRELHTEDLLRQYNQGEITYQQYLAGLQIKTTEAALRNG
jgi:hypothetical protein